MDLLRGASEPPQPDGYLPLHLLIAASLRDRVTVAPGFDCGGPVA
jgi:hypothetical protein